MCENDQRNGQCSIVTENEAKTNGCLLVQKERRHLANSQRTSSQKQQRHSTCSHQAHRPTSNSHRRLSSKHPSLSRTLSVASRTGELTSHKIFLTVCVYVTFFELGLVGSVMGPTIVHMQYLLDTDITGMTLTFVFQRVGYLIGVVLSGLLFDRFNQELQFAIGCLVEGLAIVLAPFSPHVYYYYAAMATQTLAHGYINTGLQSFLLGLWEGRKHKSPIMQGTPAVWSIGASICPFIVRPFLVNIPEHSLVDSDALSDVMNTTNQYEATALYLVSSNTTEMAISDDITRVRYPYVIVGFSFAALSILYMIAYTMLGPECDRKVFRSKKRRRRKMGDRNGVRIPMLAMLFLFFMFHAWYEGIFSGMLTAFVIEGLDWAVSTAPLVPVVFFAAHAVGRLVGIPVSVVVSSTKMLATSLILTTLAFCIMLFVPVRGDVFMWIATGLAGFAMATTYASTILWSSKYMTITGAAGAVFLIGGSTGGMTGGALIGWLVDTQTYMWLVYMALSACVIHLVLFSAMYVFANYHKKKVDAHKKQFTTNVNAHIVQTLELIDANKPVSSV